MVLDFPGKRKIDPKIIIFVLLRAIVSQNAIITPRDRYVPERKNFPHASACALYAVYRLTRYTDCLDSRADAQTTLK